jgi:hypothetical protein
MALFRRDAREALTKARVDLVEAEAKAAELQGKRAGALTGDDVAAIAALDRQIETAHRTAAIHIDRINALSAEVAELERERREAARAMAIDVIAKRLAERDRLGAELENAVRKVGDLYFALLGSGDVAADWPPSFPAPRPNFGLIPVDSIRKEMGWLLFSVGRPTAGKTALPGPDNTGLGVTGINPQGLAACVAGHSATLLELLRMAPLGDVSLSDERNAA